MQDNLAGRLWAARGTGDVVARKDVAARVDSMAAALEVSRAQARAAGPIVGWKLGATAAGPQAMLGLDGPFLGPIYEGDLYQNGADVPVWPGQGPRAEVEYALVLAGPLPVQAQYPREALAGAIAAVHGSLEIVGCRIEGGPAGGGPFIVADGGGNVGSVLGPALPEVDFMTLPARCEVADETAAEGGGVELMWADLTEALGWLAARQGELVRPLAAGDVVQVGTMTGAVPVRPGDRVVGDFGGLGAATARIVAAAS